MSEQIVVTSKEYLNMLKHGNLNQRAAAIAVEFGNEEASHHKQYIIDQMLHIICGSAYKTVIEAYEKLHGERWDVGIAP